MGFAAFGTEPPSPGVAEDDLVSGFAGPWGGDGFPLFSGDWPSFAGS